jgi:hypothetical protein
VPPYLALKHFGRDIFSNLDEPLRLQFILHCERGMASRVILVFLVEANDEVEQRKREMREEL